VRVATDNLTALTAYQPTSERRPGQGKRNRQPDSPAKALYGGPQVRSM
jgi:hypothetical protein